MKLQTEAAEISKTSEGTAHEAPAGRLGYILDDLESSFRRQHTKPIHVGRSTAHVYWKDRLCARRDLRFHVLWVYSQCVVHFGENRDRAHRRNGKRGRNPGVSRNDDFITRTDSCACQGTHQGRSARASGDRLSTTSHTLR